MGTGGLAVALIAALGLVPAASAGTPDPTVNLGSAGPLEYLRTKYPQVVTQAGPVTECEENSLTGGGAAIGGSGKKGHLNASGPVPAEESWIAEGRTADPDGETVTSWAICGPGVVSRATSTENVGPNTSQANYSLACPSGEVPLSGGIVGTAGDPEILGTFPAMTPNAFTHSFANESPVDGEAVFTTLCAGYATTIRDKATDVKEKRPGKAVAKCRSGEAVVGGGVKVTRGTVWQQDVPALAIRPWDSPKDKGKTPEDGFYAKSFNGTNKRVTLTSYAVCISLVDSA